MTKRVIAHRAITALAIVAGFQSSLALVTLLYLIFSSAGGASLDAKLNLHLPILVSFLATGAWLMVGSKDRRGSYLGLSLILIAASFSHKPNALLALQFSSLSAPVQTLVDFPADIFQPLVFWLFVSHFPKTRSLKLERLGEKSVLICLGLACVLGALQLAEIYLDYGWVSLFSRKNDQSFFWIGVHVPVVLAHVFSIYKVYRNARSEGKNGMFGAGLQRSDTLSERYRLMMYMLALLLASLPALVFGTLGAISPEFAEYVLTGNGAYIGEVSRMALITIPVSTAYALTTVRLLPTTPLKSKLKSGGLNRFARTLVLLIAVLLAYVATQTAPGSFGERLLSDSTITFACILLAAVVSVDTIGKEFSRRLRSNAEAVHVTEELDALAKSDASGGDFLTSVQAIISRYFESDACDFTTLTTDTNVTGASVTLPPSRLFGILLGSSQLAYDLQVNSELWAGASKEEKDWLARNQVQCIVPLGIVDGGGALRCILIGPKNSQERYSKYEINLMKAVGKIVGLRLNPISDATSESSETLGVFEYCEFCGEIARSQSARCAECESELTTSQIKTPVAARYQVTRCLGTGSVGEVFEARDKLLDRTVALKALRIPTREAVSELMNEAKMMSRLSHPGLAILHDLLRVDGRFVLVSELMRDGTLADFDRLVSTNERSLIYAVIEICEALEYLHLKGYVHGDIKPSNIGCSEGRYKLLDFGFSSQIMFIDDFVRGTPRYLSPNLRAGGASVASDDVWALARTLLDCLCSKHQIGEMGLSDSLGALRDISLEHSNLHSILGSALLKAEGNAQLAPKTFRLKLEGLL